MRTMVGFKVNRAQVLGSKTLCIYQRTSPVRLTDCYILFMVKTFNDQIYQYILFMGKIFKSLRGPCLVQFHFVESLV